MAKGMSSGERQDIRRLLAQQEAAELEALSAQDVGWEKRVEDRKQKVAIGQLKVEKEVAELAKIDAELERLTRQKEDVEQRIARKMPFEKRRHRDSCPSRKSLCEAIAGICSEIDFRETARDVTGKKAQAIAEKYRNRRALLEACTSRDDARMSEVLGN